MIGKKFGVWTVLDIVRDKRKRSKYKCQCKCGKIQDQYPGNLHDNATGCKECYLQSMTPSMIDKQFGQWKVLSLSHSDGNNKYYNCVCSCGTEKVCNGSHLRRGMMLRCFTCKNNLLKTHGLKNTTTWVIWMGIKARCLNPKNAAYNNYGGRGITVCDKWLEFMGFYEDMGERPKGLQIDRIDNDKGYYKENCRWVTPKENSANRRKI